MDLKTRFGRAVRERRKGLGLSQEDLAMRIGADQAYVSRVEAGQINATLESVEELAKALETDARELLG